MIDKVQFQMALGAVKHFGKNLYTSNPPAIAELIANAWDAYAKKCQIVIQDNSMVIIDDGIGMTDEELTERYAKSGFEKNENVRKPDNMEKRPYMGKKGIGKFSAFSLSDSYIILTKSIEDLDWKKMTLTYDELYCDKNTFDVQVEHIDDPVALLEQTLFPPEIPTISGPIIILTDLKRSINAGTKKSLFDLIAKRFSSSYFGGKYNFELVFNFEDITTISLREHFFYPKVENVYFFGKEKNDLKILFPNVKDENFIDKTNDYFKTNASGWMGTVEKPNDLKTDDEETSIAGVAIYINGKIADENIFKSSSDGRIPNAYLIGEVDFIISTDEDPVLSSREGLNHELKEVIQLKKELLSIRNDLFDNWNNMRSNRDLSKQDYLEKIIAHPTYRNIYDKYDDKERKQFKSLAQKIFDKPSEKNEEEIEIITPALIQIINDKALNDLSKTLGKSTEDILELFSKLFNVAEINHALRLRSNFENRLKIIQELEKYIINEEVEKVFENHLATNPWLIHPSWERRNIRKVSTQDKFSYLNIDNSIERSRTDIIIETCQSNYPIIIELKRSKKTNYSCPDSSEIRTQISLYRTAIVREYEKNGVNINIYDISAYFLCGKAEKDKMYKTDIDLLSNDKIVILTYNELVDTAKSIYRFDVEDE